MSTASRIIQVSEPLPSVLLHSGREDFVFRPQDGLKGLLNVHQALIAKVLDDPMSLHYLLYSPIYPATSTPFGLITRPSSCAVVSTNEAFIITKNYHTATPPPEIYVVNFRDMLTMELGKAMLLGWVRIQFRCGQDIKAVAILFGAASGMPHFMNALKAYTDQLEDGSNVVYSGAASQDVPPYFPSEHPAMLFTLRKREVVVREKRFWGTSVRQASPPLDIMLERRGLIVIEEKRDLVSIATDLLFIPYAHITGCHSRRLVVGESLLTELTIDVGGAATPSSILFEAAQDEDRQRLEKDIVAASLSEGVQHEQSYRVNLCD